MNSLFDNDGLESTPSATVDIHKLYTEKYLPGKRTLIERGEFTKTMYNFMVKGKTVTDKVKAQKAAGITVGNICKVWEVNVSDKPGVTDLTLRRLYACLSYDNAFLGDGPGVQDYTPPDEERVDRITKFIPSMSTSIDWTKLCTYLNNNAVKNLMKNAIQFCMTPGIQYVYRIWKDSVARSQTENNQMITAMCIGSICSDMGRHNSYMKDHPTIVVNTILTVSVAMEERGSLSSFYISAAGASGMTMDLVKSSIITAELDAFIGSKMTCSSPSKGKQAVKDTLAKYMPADGNVPGREELLKALKIRTA